MTEEWRPVVDWEGRYEVSDMGRIRSKDMQVGARAEGTALRRGRMLVQVPKQGRYLAVTFANGLWRAQQLVHNVVLEAFVGSRPQGMQACHRDDDKGNNALDNLYYGTPQQNADDRVANGNSGKGEASPRAKLTERQVLTIREMSGSLVAIAARYGITPEHVGSIKARRCWKHI